MNYYERHLGDYARDAGHLSMLEHGAYTLLLDRYYTTERGIPADQAHRVCRARTREEREAVDTVLAEFFTLEDGCWVNGRATREVTKMQAKVKAAQENGKRGGRPSGTKPKPNGNPPGSDSVTQPKAHQSPDTSSSEANASDGATAPASPAPEPPSPPPPPPAPPPVDGKAALWRESLLVLQAGGCKSEDMARSFMGKLVKDHGAEVVREAVTAAIVAQPADAREYLTATCKRLKGDRREPLTVPSDDADKTAEYLRQQAERVTSKPPAGVLALARKAVRTA